MAISDFEACYPISIFFRNSKLSSGMKKLKCHFAETNEH